MGKLFVNNLLRSHAVKWHMDSLFHTGELVLYRFLCVSNFLLISEDGVKMDPCTQSMKIENNP